MDRKTVTNVILGKEVDCVPAGFWFHFPAEQHSGDAAVQAHLDLAKAIDLDMLKIMTESLMPYGDIRCAADWKKLKPFTRQSPFIVEQIDLMKRVCDKLGDDKAARIAMKSGAMRWRQRFGRIGMRSVTDWMW